MRKYYTFLIAVVVIVVDQLIKYLVLSRLYFAENISIISHYLSLTKVYNTGAAFSLFENSTTLLTIFSLIVSIVIIVYIIRRNTVIELPFLLAWGLILGGTVGNFIDRLMYGYVIDFIKLDFIQFPIFNIADLSINLGAFIVIAYSFIKYRKSLLETK